MKKKKPAQILFYLKNTTYYHKHEQYNSKVNVATEVNSTIVRSM